MLREDVYIKMAEEFQTPVGVAVSITPKRRRRNTQTEVVDRVQLDINSVVLEAIELDMYQSLFRKVYEMEKKYSNKRIQKHTIYKKALKEIKNER